jgi:hypothetical protein
MAYEKMDRGKRNESYQTGEPEGSAVWLDVLFGVRFSKNCRRVCQNAQVMIAIIRACNEVYTVRAVWSG